MKGQNKFFPENGSTDSGISAGGVFLKFFRQAGGAQLRKSSPAQASSLAQHSDIFSAVASQAPFLGDFRSNEGYLAMQKAVAESHIGPKRSV